MAVSTDIQKLGKLGKSASEETVKKYEDKLLSATNHGHIPDIVALLELGVDPNCCASDDNVMPLHIVAARGDMVLFDVLYKTNKLDLNVVSKRGTPALIIGITSMHDKFVKTMAERGANVNITDRFLRTPLHHSIFTVQLKMMKILLDHNCNRNPMDIFFSTPLSAAAIDVANFDMVKTLVEAGVEINFYRGSHLLPFILELTLHCTDENRLEIAEYLLKNGLDVNALDPRTGRNALHYVALSNNVRMAKLLLKSGTMVATKDLKFLYPYEVALQHKNEQVAEVLEAAHAERRPSFWGLGARKNQTALPTLVKYFDKDEEYEDYS